MGFALALALAGRWDLTLPGTDVPQSAQTLAVVVGGGLLPPVTAGAGVIAYLLAGGLGLPVFADGASGWSHLAGPTAGYLAGFLVAAIAVSRSTRVQRSLPFLLGVGLLAHVLILLLGWSVLAARVGGGAAWGAGVRPFLLGGLAKSALAALLLGGVAAAVRASGLDRRPSDASFPDHPPHAP